MLYVDGSLNGKGLDNIVLEYSLKFDFKEVSNQVEYKALVVREQFAKEVGAWALDIRSNSQLVIAQLWGEYEVKAPLLIKYAQIAKGLLKEFDYNL